MKLRRNRQWVVAAAIVTIIMLLHSCSESTAYYHFEHVDAAGWEMSDPIVFALPKQLHGTYHMTLCVRTTHQYPYRNLALRLTQRQKDDEKSANVQLTIVDKQGHAEGQRGIAITETTVDMGTIKLDSIRPSSIVIGHAMHREDLPGITDIGIRLQQ